MLEQKFKFALLLPIAISLLLFFVGPNDFYTQVILGSLVFTMIGMIFLYEKDMNLTFVANAKIFAVKLVAILVVAIPIVCLTVWLSHYLGK